MASITPDPAAAVTAVHAARDGRAVDQLDGHHPDIAKQDAADGPLREAMQDIAHLRAKLETMPIIEQAKGILMLHYQVDADAAFALLCRWSSHTNTKLRDISRLLVETASRQTRTPADPLTAAEVSINQFTADLSRGHLPQ